MAGETILGIAVPSADPIFLGVVGVHVAFGLGCVVSGAFAMLSGKRRGGHTKAGLTYYWCMVGAFVTMSALAAMRWAEDYILFALGLVAFALVAVGRLGVTRRWGLRLHATCMGMSYIVLLTAFYVDNGPNLPVWKDLPHVAYWTVPALLGVPLIVWTWMRHPLLRRT